MINDYAAFPIASDSYSGNIMIAGWTPKATASCSALFLPISNRLFSSRLMFVAFIVETPIPKAKPSGCRAKLIEIGKLNNPAKRRVGTPQSTAGFLPVIPQLFARSSLVQPFNSRSIFTTSPVVKTACCFAGIKSFFAVFFMVHLNPAASTGGGMRWNPREVALLWEPPAPVEGGSTNHELLFL